MQEFDMRLKERFLFGLNQNIQRLTLAKRPESFAQAINFAEEEELHYMIAKTNNLIISAIQQDKNNTRQNQDNTNIDNSINKKDNTYKSY
jgi:UDP-N-acetylenolpyruvoylglucosamine reductase